MKVSAKCPHRTVTVDAPWEDLSAGYLHERLRLLVLACPQCVADGEAVLDPETLYMAHQPRAPR